jgi:hypothetical protein
MRSGDRDALRWAKIDVQAGTILVDEQWNSIVRAITPPKHGSVRTIALTDPARARLLALPRESEFVFTTLRRTHYRPSRRSHHWNRVRCSAGLGSVDLYTATRNYFGWYAWNVLERDARHRAPLRPPRRRRTRAQAVCAPRRATRTRARREAFRQAPSAPGALVAATA